MNTATSNAPASPEKPAHSPASVVWFENLTNKDIAIAGGKNASLGELVQALRPKGIRVPDGFAVTAEGYREFVHYNDLGPLIEDTLARFAANSASLADASRSLRIAFRDASFPPDLLQEISLAYHKLCKRAGVEDLDVAVRSSATAEDLPDASFAGQQETFLNISGERDLLYATKNCFASLFTERAISYREQKGFEHSAMALSVGVQRMIRSDRGASGVIFTIDTETGFPDTIVINGSYGLGESVVKGLVTPDEFRVFKPLLDVGVARPILARNLGSKEVQMVYGDKWSARVRTRNTPLNDRNRFCIDDDTVLELARWAVLIEKHYGRPMDIEWALDGDTGELFIVQARPETVQSRKNPSQICTYRITAEADPEPILRGLAIGDGIASGTTAVFKHLSDAKDFREGQILVASQTDPDWVPLMKLASAIITDHGGRTSHAAIVSRELGVPAVIGTGDATRKLYSREEVTVSCANGGAGEVYRGLLPFEVNEVETGKLPETRTKIMLNVANPDAAFHWWRLPCQGTGLARMEFIISNLIKIHPMALARLESISDEAFKVKVRKMTEPYPTPSDFFIETLACGIASIAAAHHPHPAIVRLSDFKTNEYAHLIGGDRFEPEEENPMLGFRGASRYYSDSYRPGFALECAAIKKAREQLGFTNIIVMVPFCRTTKEADRVLEVMAENGLVRREKELKVYMMAEIPSNIILAEQFAERFDGFSIGSNDLTQLVLGTDRDSHLLSHLFDERDEAVTTMIRQLIEKAHACGKPVGICGQAPSDYPDFLEFLVGCGIDSISLNPDSVIAAIRAVAAAESTLSPKDD